jgi:hypothetical protein
MQRLILFQIIHTAMGLSQSSIPNALRQEIRREYVKTVLIWYRFIFMDIIHLGVSGNRV